MCSTVIEDCIYPAYVDANAKKECECYFDGFIK